jgi:pimeloyl-ACP methyl ester carboxylesterase
MTSRSDFVSGYSTSDGAKIYFESAGNGPAVVFIHAGVADCRMWEPQFELFSRKFRAIRYDLRGFGQSELPDTPYANRRDLRNVLQHLGVEKAALIGCSMGGATAIDFTIEHPERVTAIVPVGAGVGGWNVWTDAMLRHFGEFMRLAKEGDTERARERDAKLWLDGPSRDASRIDPVYRQRARQLHRDNFSLTRFLHPEEELKPPAIARLGEIKAPALVMVGDADAPEMLAIADRLAADISGAKRVTIRDAAHLPNLEHPDQFNRIVMEFLTPIL